MPPKDSFQNRPQGRKVFGWYRGTYRHMGLQAARELAPYDDPLKVEEMDSPWVYYPKRTHIKARSN